MQISLEKRFRYFLIVSKCCNLVPGAEEIPNGYENNIDIWVLGLVRLLIRSKAPKMTMLKLRER